MTPQEVPLVAPVPPPEEAPPAAPPRRSRTVPVVLAAITGAVLLIGAMLVSRSSGGEAAPPLANAPKPVSVIEARASEWRARHRYVGEVEPWLSARVGPQYVSAYVEEVLVRPGARVRRGDVLARLDCRHVQVAGKALAQQSKAAQALQKAAADESARLAKLQAGGFASVVETELKRADAESRAAQLSALDAQAAGTALQADDCVLRAPFDGEIAERNADPGTFARPGSSLLTVVDRSRVRIVSDVSEDDFTAVAPGSRVHVRLVAAAREFDASVSRRSPAADASTRTVRFEIDVTDPSRTIPVGTSADLSVDVGDPAPATELSILAASVKGGKANLFLVEGDVAHTKSVKVLGEREGELFVDPTLKAGSLVVTQGRTALSDGDRVLARRDTPEGSLPNARKEGLQ